METFDFSSIRAREARLGKVFRSAWARLLVVLLALSLLALGGALIYAKDSLGWLVISLSAPVWMFFGWMKKELLKVPAGKTDNLNDILSRDCLAEMPKMPTLKDIVKIVRKTKSGRFLAIRFGIAPIFLAKLAEEMDEDVAPIFSEAKKIREKTNSPQINGAILALAIVKNHPNHEKELSRLKLSFEDACEGVIWFNYLNGIMKEKPNQRTGGIARDFTFGYTPLLQRFGTNLSNRFNGVKTQILQGTRTEILEKMVETFSSGGRQNVALVGPYGSGRSTLLNAFSEMILDADSKVPSNLKFRQIFVLDASAVISSASDYGGVENLMIRILNEAFLAKNIILCLDNAHLFFEDGVGAVNISNVLLPVISAGRLRMILILDQQKYLTISAQNSELANSLNKVMIEAANEDETMKIMQDQVPFLEYQNNVAYIYQALREAYRLSERYIHDVEMPGKAKLLLESAASYAEDGYVTEKSVQIAIEKTQGVKIQVAESQDERDKLLNLEDLLHQRMIDQIEAVKTVSGALRRAAAGVRSDKRPIGTFLFLGPTGVGKTELAKALSEVYFEGEHNLIRIDLNEFVTEGDVLRLIADGAKDEMSLSAQVMKKPFSVILLDEIEKAHPKVLTTLLQVLDEGILRDEKNREVSFRDAIIIATSNAGVNEIRERIERGEKVDDFKEEFTNNLVSNGEFKPEFLNRFDEICLFKPLNKEDLTKIFDLIIRSVNKTLETQKISVQVSDGAKAILVEKGYDPKLGARPMRRIVQKTVENIVAKAVLKGETEMGEAILIDENQIKEEL